MSASAFPGPDPLSASVGQKRLAAAALGLVLLLTAAAMRHWSGHGSATPVVRGVGDPWLLLHLCTVLPALPVGVVVMLRRKGGRLHRRLGRVWAVLMLLAAASGLVLGQGWSPVHALSVLVLATVPHSVWMAIRGDIRAHRRGMTILFASLVVAGFMTLLPVRLLGGWLFGSA